MRIDRECGPYGKYLVFRAKDGKGMSNTPGDENEAVVITVKDACAEEVFRAYARKARELGLAEDYAAGFDRLADRAGPNSPFCRLPD